MAIALSIVVGLVFVPAIVLAADHPFVLGRNIDDGDRFIYVVFASLVLGVLGLFWCALVVLALARRVRRTWWVATPVVTGVLAALLVVLFPAPGFSDSRDEMDALVGEVRTDPPEKGYRSYDPPRQVGALEVASVTIRPGGEIWIGDADASLFRLSGWVYFDGQGVPEMPTGGKSGDVSEHFDGPWWCYSYAW